MKIEEILNKEKFSLNSTVSFPISLFSNHNLHTPPSFISLSESWKIIWLDFVPWIYWRDFQGAWEWREIPFDAEIIFRNQNSTFFKIRFILLDQDFGFHRWVHGQNYYTD